MKSEISLDFEVGVIKRFTRTSENSMCKTDILLFTFCVLDMYATNRLIQDNASSAKASGVNCVQEKTPCFG